jgi:hypothetical protein
VHCLHDLEAERLPEKGGKTVESFKIVPIANKRPAENVSNDDGRIEILDVPSVKKNNVWLFLPNQ